MFQVSPIIIPISITIGLIIIYFALASGPEETRILSFKRFKKHKYKQATVVTDKPAQEYTTVVLPEGTYSNNDVRTAPDYTVIDIDNIPDFTNMTPE